MHVPRLSCMIVNAGMVRGAPDAGMQWVHLFNIFALHLLCINQSCQHLEPLCYLSILPLLRVLIAVQGEEAVQVMNDSH